MAKRTCTAVDDGVACGRPHKGRGLCSMHLQRARYRGEIVTRPTPTMTEQLWMRISHSTNGCWPWIGHVQIRTGYGTYGKPQRYAHRVVYELLVEPIPDGQTLDHLCHTNDPTCSGRVAECPHRRCVNPSHLEPVTISENIRRGRGPSSLNRMKTQCSKGHSLTDPANVSVSAKGSRRCRICKNAAERDRKRRIVDLTTTRYR